MHLQAFRSDRPPELQRKISSLKEFIKKLKAFQLEAEDCWNIKGGLPGKGCGKARWEVPRRLSQEEIDERIEQKWGGQWNLTLWENFHSDGILQKQCLGMEAADLDHWWDHPLKKYLIAAVERKLRAARPSSADGPCGAKGSRGKGDDRRGGSRRSGPYEGSRGKGGGSSSRR